jgi:hypothetical protein
MRRSTRGQEQPPQRPANSMVFSGRYRISSKKSWNQFVSFLVLQNEQAFQILLRADDEISAVDIAQQFVQKLVVPYLRRAVKTQRVWLNCDSELAMPLGDSSYFSVTFVARTGQRISKS